MRMKIINPRYEILSLRLVFFRNILFKEMVGRIVRLAGSVVVSVSKSFFQRGSESVSQPPVVTRCDAVHAGARRTQ